MIQCGVCGKKLNILGKFKCLDGYICKDCYKKASCFYTETTVQKSIEEIKVLCNKSKEKIYNEDFEISYKIGGFLLFDDKRRKVCIISNRIVNKKVVNPEIYSIKDIVECRIVSKPQYTLSKLEDMIIKKDGAIINSLTLVIRFSNNTEKEIVVIENPVRVKSFAFSKSLYFAKRGLEKIQELSI